MIQLQCRECGCYNRSLLLYETKGGFECSCCGSLNIIVGWKDNCFPIVRSEEETDDISENKKTHIKEVFLERIQHIPKGFYAY